MAQRKHIRRARQFAASFAAGMGALASLWPQASLPRYPHASATDALRGDGVRIGRDMQRVIERDGARGKAKQKQLS
jgi:hypothetical protein